MALRRMSEKFTRPKNKAAAPEEDSDSADFPNAIAKSEPAKPDARADSKTDLAAEKGAHPAHAPIHMPLALVALIEAFIHPVALKSHVNPVYN